MLDGLSLLIGLGIIAFLFLYFIFNLDEKHFLLKLLMSFFFIGILLLIPKVLIDHQDNCNVVIANETVTGNVTSYEYKEHCETDTYNTPTILYKTIMGFIRIYILYIFLYFNYVMWFEKILDDWGILKKKKKEND